MERILFYAFAISLLLGCFDKITGNRFGLGEAFDEGFTSMGPLALSMVGMLCLAPVIAEYIGPLLTPIFQMIGCDPSLIGTILANDMGGYTLARELAINEEAGLLSGAVTSSMLGCTLVAIIPLGLRILSKDKLTAFSQGLLIGIVAIPLGTFVGGVVAGFRFDVIIANTLPILIVSIVLAVGLKLVPTRMINGCLMFGKGITVVIYLGLAAAAFEHLTDIVLVPGMAPLEESMAVIAEIGIVLLGTYPCLKILTRILKKPLCFLGEKIHLKEKGVQGLLYSAANAIPAFYLMKDMDENEVIVNMAWMVPAASAIGDHLGFTAGVYPTMIMPMIIGKLSAGILAVFIALCYCSSIQKKQDCTNN